MKKNGKYIIFAVVIVLLLIIAGILSTLKGRVPDNDISVTGNTAGNLNQHGLFCESDGRVYFANAYDNYALYSMNPDETEFIRLGNGSVSSINAAGDYLYYFMDTSKAGEGFGYVLRTYGVFRTKKNGNNTICLVRDGAVTMQLCGNYLYYQRYNNKDFTKFYKLKTDKSENLLISDDIINPASCDNGIIYYNGQDKDHYLYALDTRTDTSSVIYEGDLWFPVYKDGYVYYMDVGNNYQLCRYSLYETRYWVKATFLSLKLIFTRQVSSDEISGPIGVASSMNQTFNEAAKSSTIDLILNWMNYIVLLSANLGVMNLLPIPGLDGGRFLFLLIEAVTRKKVPKDKENLVTMIGFVLVMLLMVVILFNDIKNVFFG